MSDRNESETPMAATSPEGTAAPVESPAPISASTDALDDIEGIDFLLEEIENKIAPLALA